MKKKFWNMAVLVLIACLGLAGCGNALGKANVPVSAAADDNKPAKQNNPPGMEGYVVQKEDGRILVVDPVPKNSGNSEYFDAIWFSGVPDNMELGQKVKVWFSLVAESYPGQSKAEQIEVLPDVRPEGARLTEAEAIAKALESGQAKKDWPIVKQAEHDKNARLWTVTFRLQDKDVSIKVPDVSASGAAGKKPSKDTARPGIEGYIVKKEGGRILVIDPVPKDFGSTGGIKEFYNAIWFSRVPDDIKIGQKVKVWFSLVAESYPGQSSAEALYVLPDVRPEGARLTEAEAIAKALESGQAKKDWPKVNSAVYDSKAHIWTVNLKLNDKDVSIQVPDK